MIVSFIFPDGSGAVLAGDRARSRGGERGTERTHAEGRKMAAGRKEERVGGGGDEADTQRPTRALPSCPRQGTRRALPALGRAAVREAAGQNRAAVELSALARALVWERRRGAALALNSGFLLVRVERS